MVVATLLLVPSFGHGELCNARHQHDDLERFLSSFFSATAKIRFCFFKNDCKQKKRVRSTSTCSSPSSFSLLFSLLLLLLPPLLRTP